MKKMTRKIAALLTAAVVALTAVILPDTGGLIPKLLTSASAAYSYTVTFDAAGGSPTPAAQSGPTGTKIIKPAQDPVKEGYTFEGWYLQKLYIGQEGKSIISYFYFEELNENDTITRNTIACAKWSRPAVKTSFKDADGTMKTVEAIPLDGHERILDSGWYVVDRDLNFSKTLYITGDAKIILSDGKTMYYGTESAPMTGESINFCIDILSGSLSFYTQSEGTGGMYVNMATNGISDAGIFASENTVLNFNGGKYNFRVNGSSARGISAWNINITDGTFRFSDSYTGLDASKLNISGGDLYIRTHYQGSTRAIYASDITVSGGKFDLASSYGINTGTITITDGVFKVNGAMYSGGGIWASGDIKILGGQYSDTQSPWSLVSRGAIYFSYQNPDDFIEITQYDSGQGGGRKVNFLKPFYLDGTTTEAVANNQDDYNIRWKKLVPKTQTVTVVAKDTENNDVKSSAAGKKTVVYGGKADLTAPDVDGYVFRGWYNGDTLLSSDYEYTTDEIKQDTTIKALYELISAAGASSLFGPLKNGLYVLESKTYTLTEDIFTLGRIYVPD
ncbi:MAG: InlB B-repeat-containing protein, partial [Oscillospiraceae bacterium]|nr:InlB B-repeat-containing protein [Oscillospiraceae bacterium]